MLSFQPPPPSMTNMKHFLREINSHAIPPEELICGEYCFHHCVNPFQHPSFDDNIHHLTALLTALSNTCGGVVQLCTHDGTVSWDRKHLSSYISRLLSMANISENLVEIYPGGGNTSWALIAAKSHQDIFFYNSGNNSIKFAIDINGKLLLQKFSQKSEEPEASNNSDKAERVQDEAPDTSSKGIIDVGGSPPSNRRKISTADKDDEGETVQAPVEFSTELNWDTNKKNWDEILGEANKSTDECTASCAVWKPCKPMQVTPDRDSLKYLFPSDAECMDTISKLETETPGFAIASRSWISLLPKPVFVQRPPSHLCDFLTVATADGLNLLRLWVIVSRSTEQDIKRQIQYMLLVGRAIKHQLSKQDREVPNLAIRCMLHSPHTEDNTSIEHTLHELGIQDMQKFLCLALNDASTFDYVKRCVALLLLSQESPIKTCIGNHVSVKLSAQQAETLLEIKRNKVSYVSSAPGTGKTLCGLALYRDFGRERSVYICPTEPLIHYLRYNGCEATLVRNDEELNSAVEGGSFVNKRCVIIDESHRLRCSKAGLEKLFGIIEKGQMRLIVFADNSYQSFDVENQKTIQIYIHDLSMKVFGYYPHHPIFTEIYRNTRKVVSFLQHAVEDTDSGVDIACGNTYDGDGIQCIAMENPASDNSSSNDLVQYLRPLLGTRYQVTDVAVLLDSSYTDHNICNVHEVLRSHLPRVATHSAAKFPREGIIVDRVERFAGLDATLCIFLLSYGTATNPEATIENARYRVYLASRATHKAVFIVPRIDADCVRHMKFDQFQVSFII